MEKIKLQNHTKNNASQKPPTTSHLFRKESGLGCASLCVFAALSNKLRREQKCYRKKKTPPHFYQKFINSFKFWKKLNFIKNNEKIKKNKKNKKMNTDLPFSPNGAKIDSEAPFEQAWTSGHFRATLAQWTSGHFRANWPYEANVNDRLPGTSGQTPPLNFRARPGDDWDEPRPRKLLSWPRRKNLLGAISSNF